MKKRIASMMATVIAVTGLSAGAAALADAPLVEYTEFMGNGRVEVEFVSDVWYENAQVTVQDAQGNGYTATIIERDDDGFKFSAEGLTAGTEYTYTISGVRAERTEGYGQVADTFVADDVVGAVRVDGVEYDRMGYVEVDFDRHVVYNDNVSIVVTDKDGNEYQTSIRKRDKDEIEFDVIGLTDGEKYYFTIEGVTPEAGLNANDTQPTIDGSFYAIDD